LIDVLLSKFKILRDFEKNSKIIIIQNTAAAAFKA